MLKIIDKIIVSDQAPKGKNVLWLHPTEKGYQIKVKSNDGYTTISSGSTEEHEYVDLGLPSGTLWATCDIGSDKPENAGNKYAWGEIKVKEEYTDENSLTNGLELPDISGNPQYDASRVHWGGAWRIPTYEEWLELGINCRREVLFLNGKEVIKVIGPNGNSIIFSQDYEDSGQMLFQCSTPSDYDHYPLKDASYAGIVTSRIIHVENIGRSYGAPVRPVKSK